MPSYSTKRRRICAAVAQVVQQIELSTKPPIINVNPVASDVANVATEIEPAIGSCSADSHDGQELEMGGINYLSDSDSDSDGSELDLSSISTSDSDSDSDENVNEVDNQAQFKYELAQWKLKGNITNSSMNSLLEILRKRVPFLPKDCRTIVTPPKNVQLKDISGGQYYHFGIASTIRHVLRNKLKLTEGQELHLQLNVDGLPVHKSKNSQLWPILGLLQHPESTKPFVIGVFFGECKPKSVTEFLEDFMNEYTHLSEQGLVVNGYNLKVTISTVVCDSPARAFVKCTKVHSGYSACDKCTVHGEWHGRVTFLDLKAPLRTDDSFIRQSDGDHHRGAVSPFLRANVGEYDFRKVL